MKENGEMTPDTVATILNEQRQGWFAGLQPTTDPIEKRFRRHTEAVLDDIVLAFAKSLEVDRERFLSASGYYWKEYA